MTFVLILILLVLVFGAGWLRGAIGAVFKIAALAMALWLPVRVFDLDPSTVIYSTLAVIGALGFLATTLFPKHWLPKWGRIHARL